ncbi:hypothetical protein [Mycobacterium sp. URHB0044]|uniref:Rv0361 family membrane protein n=1 Tax=Mycobacterium sp. URHB0044 TaxID=1380386 RepID=UPI00048E98F6|nr:hypothetical protein [Mycobacterium sp. URHB0044]
MRVNYKIVLLIAVLAAMVVGCSRETPGVAMAPAGALGFSDEDQVRDVVDRFEQSWNDADFDAMSEILCEDMRNDAEFGPSEMKEMREMAGTLTLTIADLVIDGDGATATILNDGEDPDDIEFAREDGDWKWCEY